MDYSEAIAFLDSRVMFGMKLGLDNSTILLDDLDFAYKNLRCIHIAGTNGKGSVSAMVSSILLQAGYSVGMYTSPHLVDIRERILLGRHLIPKWQFAKIMKEIKFIVDSRENFCPTYFEVLTALALYYFSQNKVDFVVLEVGMGGRLDATNVINALVSVITNIGIDHTAYLGDTKEAIASEKIQIIKNKNFVVTGEEDKAILAMIEAQVKKTKSKLLVAGSDINCFYSDQHNINYQVASFDGHIQRYRELKIPLLGQQQIKNSAIALGVIEALSILGVTIPLEAIHDGFYKTQWPGRFQIVTRGKGNYILDCAHNVDGFTCLTNTIKEYFPNKKFTVMLAFCEDKEIMKMIKLIAPLTKEFIIPDMVDNERIMLKTVLRQKIKKVVSDVKITKFKDVSSALAYCDKREAVIVTGSIFLIGEVLKVFR